MSKLQRIIIIVAAFGVVSIILTQAQSFSLADNQAIQNGAATAPAITQTVNIHPVEDSQQRLNKDFKKSASTNTTYINNIYQSGSGSFYFENEENALQTKQYLPAKLKRTKADIKITGPVARTRLTQVFSNTADIPQTGIYVFPLPFDAGVDHLLMQVGERKIEGRIERKEHAQKLFQQAKTDGKKASLVAQLRPNMFTNQIANIPPNSEITVTIEYQQFIIQDDYHYALRLPLSITERYTPKEAQVNALLNLPNIQKQGIVEKPTLDEEQFIDVPTEINISLNTGLPLTEINSEHHPIKTSNPYNTEYRITLDTQKPANKDFILNWRLKPSYTLQASHFSFQSNQYEYGLINLVPPKQDELKAKRNVVFVLDTSGSMVGDAIIQAKQSLAYAINDLQQDDYFNIVTFSTDAQRLWSQSQMASMQSKEEALSYIFNLEASGGTEIKPALDIAFNIPTIQNEKQSYLNQILFITDGSVSNENEIMHDIYQNIGDYRLFTVGIGSAPNAFFMSEAAAAGRGTFTFIGDTSLVKTKMKTLIEKLKRPALKNIQLNIKDAQNAFGFEVYPSILPDLYSGEPLVITYRREITTSLNDSPLPFSVSGQYLSQTASGVYTNRTWASQLPSINAQRERGIHKYWARQKINSLNKQLNMQNPTSIDAAAMLERIKEGIVQVALEHHLVSKYTSLIAVDHQKEQWVEKANEKSPMLSQYTHANLPSTSTPSVLYALIGMMLIILSLSFLLVTRKT